VRIVFPHKKTTLIGVVLMLFLARAALFAYAIDHSVGADEQLLVGNGDTGSGLIIPAFAHLGPV
jgi:hypothetical protein